MVNGSSVYTVLNFHAFNCPFLGLLAKYFVMTMCDISMYMCRRKDWYTIKCFFSSVFLEFRSRYQCDPDPRSRQGDMEKLAQIRDSVVESLNISKELIPDDFARLVL